MRIRIYELKEKLPRVMATHEEVMAMQMDKTAMVFLFEENEPTARITLELPLSSLPKGAQLGDEYLVRFSIEPVNRK